MHSSSTISQFYSKWYKTKIFLYYVVDQTINLAYSHINLQPHTADRNRSIKKKSTPAKINRASVSQNLISITSYNSFYKLLKSWHLINYIIIPYIYNYSK